MKTVIVMPAFNEEKVIGTVIDGLHKAGWNELIVVDDGSTDRTGKIAGALGAAVYTHPVNRGLGGALGTGIEAAVMHDADVIVTFDSDGQHDPGDIAKVIRPIVAGRADAVIGSRLLKPKGMPLIRRIGNMGLNIVTFLLFGVWTTDSQSGLRAFSKKAAEKIRIRTNRMEVSSEIIKEIGHHKLRFKEVPIRPIYTEYSRKHGQSNLNAFRIIGKLVLKKLMR